MSVPQPWSQSSIHIYMHEDSTGLRYLAMGPEEMEIFFKRMFALRVPKDAWIHISEGCPV